MSDEPIFTDGLRAYKPRDNAPDWVKADLAIDVAKFTVFINDHAKPDGSVRIQIKEGKTGNYYAALDQWTKDTPRAATTPTIEYPKDDINPDDLPF
jgi:hypothetical protein